MSLPPQRLEKGKSVEFQAAGGGKGRAGSVAFPRSGSRTREGGSAVGIISAALPFHVKSEPERKSVNLKPLLKGNN